MDQKGLYFSLMNSQENRSEAEEFIIHATENLQAKVQTEVKVSKIVDPPTPELTSIF